MKIIIGYFNLWIKENKKDFINRYETFKNYFKNYNFIINFCLLLVFGITAIFIPTFLLLFVFILVVFLIDLFLGRFIYLLNNSGLKKSSYSFVKSEFIDSVENQDQKESYENIDELTEDYIEEKINKKNYKSKIIVYLDRYIKIHEFIAKKIVYLVVFYVFKKIIPNANFDNYLVKLVYFPFLVIKKPIEIIFSLVIYIIKAFFRKIKDILIFLFLTIITAGLYLVYLFFYKHIKRIFLFFKFIFLKVILIFKLVIKYFYIGIAIGFFYFTIELGLYWLLYIEIGLLTISILLIIRSILNDFIGISLFKATPQFFITAGIGFFNPGLSTFYISILSACENEKSGNFIIDFIKGNYNSNFYNTSLNGEKVMPDNVWSFKLYNFSFLDKKISKTEEGIFKTQAGIEKTDNFIKSANNIATGKVFENNKEERNKNKTNVAVPIDWKNKLSEQDKKELLKEQKELEILRIKEEKDKLMRRKEFRKKVYKNFINTKKLILENFEKISKVIQTYSPIILLKTKKVSKKTIKKMKKGTHIITHNMSNNIETEKYKNIGVDTLNKVKTMKVNQKYKKYVILLLLLMILLGGSYIAYNKYTYYKIPQVYKDELLVFEGEPDEIYFKDTGKIILHTDKNSEIEKTFGFNSDSIEESSGKNQPVAAYEVMKSKEVQSMSPEEKKQMESDFKETKKEGLKESIKMNYDIYTDTVALRFSNYDGEISPYKSKKFKKLNSKVSNQTYLATYLNYKNIEKLENFYHKAPFSTYDYSHGDNDYSYILSSFNIMSDVITDDMEGDINELYSIFNTNLEEGTGEVQLELYMFDEGNYDRNAEFICLQIEENFEKLQEYDDFYLRTPKCEFKTTTDSIDIHMAFKGLDIHLDSQDEEE